MNEIVITLLKDAVYVAHKVLNLEEEQGLNTHFDSYFATVKAVVPEQYVQNVYKEMVLDRFFRMKDAHENARQFRRFGRPFDQHREMARIKYRLTSAFERAGYTVSDFETEFDYPVPMISFGGSALAAEKINDMVRKYIDSL